MLRFRAQRLIAIGLIGLMAAIAVMGYVSVRRGVQNLRIISQDNILWTATQMEVELLRFKLSLGQVAIPVGVGVGAGTGVPIVTAAVTATI